VGNCRLEENALPLEKWAVGLSGVSGCPDFVYDWRALLRAEAQQSLASGSEWGVRCSSEVNAGGQPAYFRRFVSGSARNDTRVKRKSKGFWALGTQTHLLYPIPFLDMLSL